MDKHNKSIEVYSCFPKDDQIGSFEDFIDRLTKKSKESTSDDEKNKWGGFFGESYLADALKNKFNDENYKEYSTPSSERLQQIESKVVSAFKEAKEVLPSKQYPVRVFIYPWFPEENEEVFEGVMGTTFVGNTFHLYVDAANFSTKSLQDTTIHEYNHSVYFSYHHPFEQSILEAMVLEGLAEHFREEVAGGESAPWSTALSKGKAVNQFKKLKEEGCLSINMEDNAEDYWDLYEEVFYGKNDSYERWTGYSIGYYIIKAFRSTKPNISWKTLIKQKPEKILAESNFLKN